MRSTPICADSPRATPRRTCAPSWEVLKSKGGSRIGEICSPVSLSMVSTLIDGRTYEFRLPVTGLTKGGRLIARDESVGAEIPYGRESTDEGALN